MCVSRVYIYASKTSTSFPKCLVVSVKTMRTCTVQSRRPKQLSIFPDPYVYWLGGSADLEVVSTTWHVVGSCPRQRRAQVCVKPGQCGQVSPGTTTQHYMTLRLLINTPSVKLPPQQETCHSVIIQTPNIYSGLEEDTCEHTHTQEPDTAAKCLPSLPTVSMATIISL